jgi:hypothetical protein
MKKKILRVFIYLILICLIFLGGFYFGQNMKSTSNTCLPENANTISPYHYVLTGRGVIEEIDDTNLSIISGEDKFNLEVADFTQFYQRVRSVQEGEVVENRKIIKLNDMQVYDPIEFRASLNEEGGFTLFEVNKVDHNIVSYGTIKKVEDSNLIITWGNNEYNIKVVDYSKLYLILESAGDQIIDEKEIELTDLKVGDKVHFDATIEADGEYTLYRLNVKNAES